MELKDAEINEKEKDSPKYTSQKQLGLQPGLVQYYKY